MSKNDIVTDAVALAVSGAQNDVLIALIQNYFDLQKDVLATAGTVLNSVLQVADELVRSNLIVKEENVKFENELRAKELELRKSLEVQREINDTRQSYRNYTLKKAEIILEQNRVTQDILQSMYRLKEIDASVKFSNETLENLKVESLFPKKDQTRCSRSCQSSSSDASKKKSNTDEKNFDYVWVNEGLSSSVDLKESTDTSSSDDLKKSNLKNVFKDIEKGITTISTTIVDSSIKSPIRKNLKSQASEKASNEKPLSSQPSNKPFAWEEVETDTSKPSEVSKIKKKSKDEPTSKIAKKTNQKKKNGDDSI